RDAPPQADRTQREAGVEVAVEADDADRPAVPGARRLLLVFDALNGRRFGGAGDGDRPGVGEEGVERVEAGAQLALHVIDGVDEARVELDLPAPDPAHRARLADARFVVAIDVG